MFTKAFVYALAAASIVNAHGRIDVLTGDLGGNGTALGVKGAVVPGGGANSVTETDTTTFWSKNIATDGDDGYTTSSGGNLSPTKDLAKSLALSGDTLPQVPVIEFSLSSAHDTNNIFKGQLKWWLSFWNLACCNG